MSITSAQAYERIRDGGLLSRMRWVVYDYLYRGGPATAREVFRGTRIHTHHSARFNELEALGVIASTGTRKCRVTGHDVKEWGVTASLPDRAGLDALKAKTRTRPRPNRQELGSALSELRALFKLGREAGRPENPALVKTGLWLVSLVREDES